MVEAKDYMFDLSIEARRAFSDAAISLSLYLEAHADDYDAKKYYWERYKFDIDFAFANCGIEGEKQYEFDFYVLEYAIELRG